MPKEVKVKLLVDNSKESNEARELLYGLNHAYPLKIQVEGVPASLDGGRPMAFWCGFSYHRIEGVTRLHKKLTRLLSEGKL